MIGNVLLDKIIMEVRFEEVTSEHRCELLKKNMTCKYWRRAMFQEEGTITAKVSRWEQDGKSKEEQRDRCEWSRFIKGTLEKVRQIHRDWIMCFEEDKAKCSE